MSAEVKHTTFTPSVLPSRMLQINLYVNRSIPQRVRDLLNVISSSRETRPTSLIINFRYFMTVAHFLLQNLGCRSHLIVTVATYYNILS